ncbi:CopD family protein [Suttonella sp. R2A3]|uniref:CopD family protein n=1 Tax=Suttonella sp. R2A3 TaxID=2908648 RepID=UPI001F361389|nr:CopD family protein [Suttonella sp. R2A3]UJF23833.1 CopD family protein [Suttonella sp. R2A3]
MTYLLWKALHIVFMVSWFAALFYLPRLYVYHAMAQENDEQQAIARFVVMERKLYIIGHIGMGLMLIFGALLLWQGAWSMYSHMGWLHAKLTLVLLLMGYWIYCGRLNKAFARGKNRHSHVFYRWFNELPVLFLIVIVLLATFKPF